MKVKTVVVAVVLAVVLVGATLLYNVLSERAGSGNLNALTPPMQRGDGSESPSTSGQQTDGTQGSPEDDTAQSPPPPSQQAGVTQEPPGDQDDIAESPPSSEQREEDIKAPDFTVQDVNGDSIKLSDLLGKPVVLNFWASWCPPCKVEMPDFNAVFEDLGEDVHFMMVCLVDGARETKETGLAYIEESGYTFPTYYDVEQNAAMEYGVRSIPTTYFIDSEGYIITGARGAIDEETLRLGISYIS